MNQYLLFATLLAACCVLMVTEPRWKITVNVITEVKADTPATADFISKMDARLEAVEETLAKIVSGEKESHSTFEEEINQLIVAHEKRCSAIDAEIAELMMMGPDDATAIPDRSLVVHAPEPDTSKALVVYRPQDFTAYEWVGLTVLVLVSAYVGRRVESYQ
jgi:hypothetical protein